MTPDNKGSGEPIRILVLEDEHALRGAVVRILELHGHEVYDAPSAAEARGALNALDEPIHLLLCDLVLEGLDGREAAIMLQARRPEMRVLFMSGFSSPNSFRNELEASEAVFLAKPFDSNTLLDAVRMALEGDPPGSR